MTWPNSAKVSAAEQVPKVLVLVGDLGHIPPVGQPLIKLGYPPPVRWHQSTRLSGEHPHGRSLVRASFVGEDQPEVDPYSGQSSRWSDGVAIVAARGRELARGTPVTPWR